MKCHGSTYIPACVYVYVHVCTYVCVVVCGVQCASLSLVEGKALCFDGTLNVERTKNMTFASSLRRCRSYALRSFGRTYVGYVVRT